MIKNLLLMVATALLALGCNPNTDQKNIRGDFSRKDQQAITEGGPGGHRASYTRDLEYQYKGEGYGEPSTASAGNDTEAQKKFPVTDPNNPIDCDKLAKNKIDGEAAPEDYRLCAYMARKKGDR